MTRRCLLTLKLASTWGKSSRTLLVWGPGPSLTRGCRRAPLLSTTIANTSAALDTMKVGGRFQGNEVPLPPEVLELILNHVDMRQPRSERQRDLWSCCVLSKSWYSATVKRIYQSPHLTTRNFDLFARTLCPPVNSHVRSVGLEEFVVNLDMGGLAYESTKSLTARLLRRIRQSLESFVAPSISFS